MFRDCVRTEQLRYMKKTERERIMYNYKIVEQVSRKKKSMSGILRKVMVIFAVFFVVLGITISQSFMLAGFLLAGLYFVYDIFSRKDYEYTLENDVLTIDVIYGKKYRKTAHVLELKDLDAAMLAALKQTNDFVLSQGKPLDPMSKAAYDEIKAEVDAPAAKAG